MNQNFRFILGVSVCLIGVPLGMYLSFFIPSVKWTHINMLLSILLISNWKNIFSFKFPISSRIITFVGAFQVLMLLYGFFSNDKATFDKWSIFQYFVLGLCVAYSSNTRSINLNKLPNYVFLLSFGVNICGAYLCSLGLVSGEEAFLMKQYDDNYVIDPLTVSLGAAINVISGIFLVKNKTLLKLLFYIAICLAIYTFLCTFKRTLILFCIVAFFVYLYKNARINLHVVIKSFKILLIAVLLFIILSLFVDKIGEKLSEMFLHLYDGILTLFGEKTTYDVNNSAVARVVQRNMAFLDFELNAKPINYIIGMGYIKYYIDAPIIESYLDMGILGLIGYFTIAVLFPLRCFFSLKTREGSFLLPLVLGFQTMFEMISAGNPYGYSQYIYIILLGATLEIFKKNNRLNYGKKNRMD